MEETGGVTPGEAWACKANAIDVTRAIQGRAVQHQGFCHAEHLVHLVLALLVSSNLEVLASLHKMQICTEMRRLGFWIFGKLGV